MTAPRPMQFASVRNGAWTIGLPTVRPVVAPAPPKRRSHLSHDAVRRQFNEKITNPKLIEHHNPAGHFNERTPAQDAPAVPPSPPPMDKAALAREMTIAMGDKEQGKIKYSGRTALEKDLNTVAFENDTPWGRRQDRATVGYASIKSKYGR